MRMRTKRDRSFKDPPAESLVVFAGVTIVIRMITNPHCYRRFGSCSWLEFRPREVARLQSTSDQHLQESTAFGEHDVVGVFPFIGIQIASIDSQCVMMMMHRRGIHVVVVVVLGGGGGSWLFQRRSWFRRVCHRSIRRISILGGCRRGGRGGTMIVGRIGTKV